MPTEPLAEKWAAFGWNVIACDGHDVAALDAAFTLAKTNHGSPTMIIANTIKGKGVSFMEGKTPGTVPPSATKIWHRPCLNWEV